MRKPRRWWWRKAPAAKSVPMENPGSRRRERRLPARRRRQQLRRHLGPHRRRLPRPGRRRHRRLHHIPRHHRLRRRIPHRPLWQHRRILRHRLPRPQHRRALYHRLRRRPHRRVLCLRRPRQLRRRPRPAPHLPCSLCRGARQHRRPGQLLLPARSICRHPRRRPQAAPRVHHRGRQGGVDNLLRPRRPTPLPHRGVARPRCRPEPLRWRIARRQRSARRFPPRRRRPRPWRQ